MGSRGSGRFLGRWRLAVAMMCVLIAAIAMFAACGGDSEPEPSPDASETSATATGAPTAAATATPAPTPAPATPTGTPTPRPATAAPTAAPTTAPATPEAVQPVGSMRDFMVDMSTTGKDLVDRLSEEEVACIQSAFGDAIFQIILVTPLMLAGTDASAGAPLFGCMTQENVVLMGTAFIASRAAGSEESRLCIADLALEHPEVIYTNMGLDWEGEETGHGSQHEFTLQFYECLTDAEAVRYFTRIWGSLSAVNHITGRDVLDAFTDPEVECFRGYFGDRYEEAFVDGLITSGELGSHEMHEECFTLESAGNLFVAASSIQLGGLTNETGGCLADFARDHEHFIDNLVLTTPERLEALPEEQFAELAGDAGLVLHCMTEEELLRFQELVAAGNLASS